MDRDTAPVSIELTLKPFLVIHTSPLPQRNRPKRNSNCLPEMKECCRDELYINFEDIGWSDWILHPSGYHAYFCRGSCSSAASLTASGSPYNNVIRVRNLCDLFTIALALAQFSIFMYIVAREETLWTFPTDYCHISFLCKYAPCLSQGHPVTCIRFLFFRGFWLEGVIRYIAEAKSCRVVRQHNYRPFSCCTSIRTTRSLKKHCRTW